MIITLIMTIMTNDNGVNDDEDNGDDKVRVIMTIVMKMVT
jgi:hypothetical protein